MKHSVMNCILAGVGGQGTVLASKLLAQTAMQKGLPAHTAETIGMAQRGGCVVSHVRIGAGAYSPLIPRHTADLLLGFEPSEAVRCLSYMKPDGVLVVSTGAIAPVTVSLSASGYTGEEMLAYLRTLPQRLVLVDGAAVCREAGSSKVLNVSLLGAAAAAGAVDFTLDDMAETIRARVPSKYVELNLRALQLGAQAAEGSKLA